MNGLWIALLINAGVLLMCLLEWLGVYAEDEQ